MTTVNFCDNNAVSDELIGFAVVAARYMGKWIFCRHRERATYEIPGGHREAGESVDETARRELYEETGAVGSDIKPVSAYSVTVDGVTTYGKLFFAEVKSLGPLPPLEITEIIFSDNLPEKLTYPEIQPALYDKINSDFLR
jgi:8-oxo-dGTP diphosphatase